MKFGAVIRNVFLVVITFMLVFLAAIQLMKIQIVNGDYYASQQESLSEATQSISAARGQIADSAGNILVTNKIVYQVIVQRAFFTYGRENEIIARTVSILESCGEDWIDNVPITFDGDFEFTDAMTEDELDQFKTDIGVNLDATADNCINRLAQTYEIDTELYDQRTVRIIAGIRFEMTQKDFSFRNKYVLASDISNEAVIKLKEQGFLLNGIDVSEEPERSYVRTDLAPHVLGTLGAISESEYQATKDENGETDYTINDVYGKTGIEAGMESVLKGTDGVRTIVRSSTGEVVSDSVTAEAQPGNSIKLTIDSDFQEDIQAILENQINWLHYNNDPNRGNECDSGGIVVLNAKTGAVLAMASYPTYDIADYLDDPAALNNAELSPMLNRATQGLYRPGSAFKTINAIAGLCEGIITKDTPGICTGTYTYYDDYQPTCTGYHYGYNVVLCIRDSCNIFFYDLARRLGIDKLAAYANLFGYGEDLGLEIPCATTHMSTPEFYEEYTGESWNAGDVLQAGIGQCVTQITPLNLAVQAMTLANDGVRYKPYLVDSIWNFDYTELISQTEVTVAATIDDNGTGAFETVREGMILVSGYCTWPLAGGDWIFDYLPYSVAIKTGTAEEDSIGKYYTSTVMGYYPAEDPQIAFGICLSKGEFSRYMIRNIIDSYFYDCYEPDMDEDGNVISPWKRWTNTNKTPVR